MQAAGAAGRRYSPGECRGRARPFRGLKMPLRSFLCPYQLSTPFWYKTQKSSDITEPARRVLGTPELAPRPRIALVVPAGGWDAPMALGGGWECAVWLGATSVFFFVPKEDEPFMPLWRFGVLLSLLSSVGAS